MWSLVRLGKRREGKGERAGKHFRVGTSGDGRIWILSSLFFRRVHLCRSKQTFIISTSPFEPAQEKETPLTSSRSRANRPTPNAQRRIRGALGRDAPKLDQTSELFPCSHVLEGLGGGHTPTGSGHSTPDRRQHERRRARVPTGRRTARLGRACCVDTECPGG